MKNLLIIHAHDVGRYCSPYGIAAQTPHLNRLARTGGIFRNMHTAAPTCSPSRAALWTGRTAHETGLLGLVHRGFDMKDRQRHLARHLAEHGFHTALAGTQHEYDYEQGEAVYQNVLPLRAHNALDRDEAVSEAATQFLRQAPEQPWMLSVGYFYPHRDFIPCPDPARANRVQVPAILPDTPEIRRDYADYLTSIEATDREVGKLLDALDAHGQAEDTLVIFTTDHGIPFPEMKCHLTGHGTGIAMLMRAPGLCDDGRAVDALTSNMDVVPTVCEILRVPTPADVHGVSMVPLLTHAAREIRDDVFAEVNFHAAAEPARAIRTTTHCLIKRFDDDPRRPLTNIDISPAKEAWLALGRGGEPLEPVVLHDLVRDPMERVNVADDPAYADVRADLEQRLMDWMRRTDDPLLRGPLVPPPGSRINTRTSLSTSEGPFEPT